MSRRKKHTTAGYKKRLASRLSGNPGPRQMWVPAYLVTERGAIPNPRAAKRISAAEVEKMRQEDESKAAEGGAL